MTREESSALGRSEYFNPANAGKSIDQVWEKFSRDGISEVWKTEFINGWYGATMMDDEEFAEWQVRHARTEVKVESEAHQRLL